MLKKILVVLGMLFSIISINHVLAETTSSNEQPGGYTIEGIPNEHQIDPASGYFYLDEGPGSKDEIKV
ncbi:TPA: DUF916 and DUF3324 domain-containing protein, partial [Enterococcus faecium]